MESIQSIIRHAAMSLLATREHSMKELCDKLHKKFPEKLSGIQSVLAELQIQGLQNDARFAMAFVRMRFRQGKGPVLIGMELKQRGVAPELAEQVLETEELDWQNQARYQRGKRFGPSLPRDARERAKQMRFLHSRGFGSDHIRDVFSGSEENY